MLTSMLNADWSKDKIVSMKRLENRSLSDSNDINRLVVIYRSRHRTQCDHCHLLAFVAIYFLVTGFFVGIIVVQV